MRSSSLVAKFSAALLAALVLSACSSPSDPAPQSTQLEWRLDADIESRLRVVITKGEPRESVVADLGAPLRIKSSKRSKESEIYCYRRSVRGPNKSTFMSTGQGTRQISLPVIFVDEVEVALEGGFVVSVAVSRRWPEESGVNSLGR